ncbi:MAG: hypothetical protein FWD60_07595 [Candidatus Azobacteroides sp.]|nr:hypothetical protein [Candidatus Azobacteroides sp.]
MKKIGKYLREISVVVIGVAITLSASYWITNSKEKRDMALYLNTIMLELEANKNILDKTIEQLQSSVKYADYLRSHDKKSLDPDIIKAYSCYYYDATPIIIKTNAFDMFKTSGNMRFVDNKELLLSIWDAYSVLVELSQQFEMFTQIKIEEIKKESQLFSLPNIYSLSAEEILKNVPMYNYYVNINASQSLLQSSEKASMKISETMAKLREETVIKLENQ